MWLESWSQRESNIEEEVVNPREPRDPPHVWAQHNILLYDSNSALLGTLIENLQYPRLVVLLL